MKFSGKLIHQKITWILFTKVQSYMSLLCFTRHSSDFFYNFCLLSGKTPQRLTKYHITYRSDRNTLLYIHTHRIADLRPAFFSPFGFPSHKTVDTWTKKCRHFWNKVDILETERKCFILAKDFIQEILLFHP